jgi:hypothetical protein
VNDTGSWEPLVDICRIASPPFTPYLPFFHFFFFFFSFPWIRNMQNSNNFTYF